jgi:hypothetical protein
VTAVFWQVGFGNALVNNGMGHNGAGIAPMGVFSGNDNGLFRVVPVDARSALRDPNVPAGSLCLPPLNWGDIDVDGCCDNERDPNIMGAMDGFLNPEFDPQVLRRKGSFVAQPERVQDYPMAVLLREETARWFAVAAVSASARSGMEDIRAGDFSFGDVAEGGPNAIDGARNVIPWRKIPEIRLTVTGAEPVTNSAQAGSAGTAPPPRWRFHAAWEAATVPTDGVHHPSKAPTIDNPGHGVGAADMGPLVWYEIQSVSLSRSYINDAGRLIKEALPWETVARLHGTEGEVDLGEDGCARVKVNFGLMPRTSEVTVDGCAVGHCGDVGFGVAGPPLCVQGPVLRLLHGGA